MKLGRISLTVLLMACPTWAVTLTYGDKDCLGNGCYGASEPTLGATLTGLNTDQITLATNSFGHGFPFTPGAGDFAGTDQIFVGSTQTGAHDGYSVTAERIPGPSTFTLDFSSIVTGTITTFTLGIAADDFQFPSLGQPFIATIDGVTNAALTNELNSLNQGGPMVQFFTVGIDPATLGRRQVMTVSIDQGGDGGDGWAVDFLTVDVTSAIASAVPEPVTMGLTLCGLAVVFLLWRKRLAR